MPMYSSIFGSKHSLQLYFYSIKSLLQHFNGTLHFSVYMAKISITSHYVFLGHDAIHIYGTQRSKFDSKSLPCVFMGYSNRHKGYRCFSPTTNKFYISQHVVFGESTLPYKISVQPLAPSTEPHATTFKELASLFTS